MFSNAYLKSLREEELRRVLRGHSGLFRNRDLLEIGSGTGDQLRVLSGICRSAVGVEISESIYAPRMSGNVRLYDGKILPFSSGSFDVVFSSHVLEHITDEQITYSEMRRVLRPGGVGVHVVPTNHWKLWTMLAHYPDAARRLARKAIRGSKATSSPTKSGNSPAKFSLSSRIVNTLIPPRHGETGSQFTEYFHLRVPVWRDRLACHGWTVELSEPIGLAYTGYTLLGERMSFASRSFLARLIGSSTYFLVVR